MPANKINVSELYDSTWKYRAKAADETAYASLAYKDNFQGWASRCPTFGDAHPDLAGFSLVEILAEREDGDQIKVQLNYEVGTISNAYPGRPETIEPIIRYSVQIAGREEHILTNSYADVLDDTERKALLAISNGSEADEEGVKWDLSVQSEEGLALLAKIRKGNVAYKTAGLIWVERKTVTDLADINYDTVGKIDDPPGPVGGGATNWLYIGATADPSEDGLSWLLERQWEYSPDGWDEDLYAVPEPP